MEVVVDASIVVKWFVEEEGSDKALRLRDKYIDGEISIIAPELIIFEVLNALYYKRLFSESEMKEISEALEAYSFTLYSLKGEYAEKTVETAVENGITIYDASYVALAMIRDTYLYTADEKLIEKLKGEYLKHVKSIKSTSSNTIRI
ncbi:type II toxin-antitoxin system VapC family toxin [Candidatus Bathyarchaeota archaeon]|nr:type II toxin-antitoxin system VapC family toxin [Candidatus Bathyarchaeota archaeon]